VNQFVIALLWALVGAAAGWGVRWASVKLARLEGLEPGNKPWQQFGPPVLTAIVFAVYGYELSPFGVLLVRSIFALVLVQVIFFDFEHHLILDRVMFPAMGFALLVAIVGKPYWPGGTIFAGGLELFGKPVLDAIVIGVATGLVFLFLALVGGAIFKAEALGFGDVKLATFMGLLMGWPYTFTAIFYGVVLAAVGAIVFIVTHRSMRGTIAYGPYLAAGALIVLLLLPA
jgi:prepilin signal peptidase PulO-like enzyme (type II secretory pathway)